ncbi:MAG: cobalamin B12-binding domain-containing protein, partial [Deltaproteobacteria bacterium]|nr:cobalamin B12-binding domain-containing protein [Deltaproteobacteria bacterium]
MNVLVVSANGCRDPLPVLPLGACMAAEAAERAGHRVGLLDLMFRRSPRQALEAALAEARPDVVAISARNIDNNDFSKPRAYYPELRSLVGAAARGGRPVVLGGASLGVMPEEMLGAVDCSWAVLGEAEGAFPALLERLASPGDGPLPPGTARRQAGAYAEGPARQPVPAWPSPDLARWLDLGAYAAHLANVPVQSKRGCPFACVYCTYPRLEGKVQRLRAPDEVAEEVERLARAGVRDVEFVDAAFNIPEEHAIGVCEALIRRRVRVGLHTSNLNPGFVGRELVRAMARAGFAGIGVS